MNTMRLLSTLLLASVAQAQDINPVTPIQQARHTIIAFLPDLQNQQVALALKKAANNNISVTILTYKNSHLLPGTYLLSVALANAQTPPAPLHYYQVRLQSPPYLIIDNQKSYYGPGLIGNGTITPGPANFTNQVLNATRTVLTGNKPVPAKTLFEERYGLTPNGLPPKNNRK